ncbi:hypothetical protein INT46_011629 [Mucor plumbeus]|uniref:Uncharacterized protein n=1 Tax=Mucor plumbeus TaxID=97098 RepID=A0A8H7R3K7_9FUNG|nr:hypothetical protein INT46_011629 [Mucor plumbeus]
MNKTDQKVQNDIDGMVLADKKLTGNTEMLFQQVNCLENAYKQLSTIISKFQAADNIKKAYQSLNKTKKEESTLNAQIFELNAHIERLNKTVYGRNVQVTSIDVDHIASVENECRNRTSQSKLKKTIRKSFNRMINMKTDANLGTMISVLKHNLDVRPQQYSHDTPEASSSSEETIIAATAETAKTSPSSSSSSSSSSLSYPALESKIGSLCSSHAKMSKQLKDLNSKYDKLANQPQTSTDAKASLCNINENTKEEGDAIPLDLQVIILRNHVNDFHKDFLSSERNVKEHLETLLKDVAILSKKQKEMDTENRYRYVGFDEFASQTTSKQEELTSLQTAMIKFYKTELSKISTYAQDNFRALKNATKKQENSLVSLTLTLDQIQTEFSNQQTLKTNDTQCDVVPDHPTTSMILYKKQQKEQEQEDEKFQLPSPMNFIDKLYGSLLSDRTILDRNCQKLKTLQSKLKSTNELKTEAKKLKEEHKQLDDKLSIELEQVAIIKEKCALALIESQLLVQNFESNKVLNGKKDQFLRQVHEL